MADCTGKQRSAAEKLKEKWKQSPPFPIALNSNPYKWKVAVSAACNSKTQLEAALVYVERGIPVFPCNWLPDKAGKVNKYPLRELGKGGLYLATIDPRCYQIMVDTMAVGTDWRAAGTSCWNVDARC
jgi:hypothetical protein